MAAAFDDDAGTFQVLVNDEGRSSLWPGFLDVPAGWAVAFGPASRRACLDHVGAHADDAAPAGATRAAEVAA
jgi:MbtH protein